MTSTTTTRPIIYGERNQGCDYCKGLALTVADGPRGAFYTCKAHLPNAIEDSDGPFPHNLRWYR